MSKYGKEVGKYLEKVQKGDKSQLGKVFDLTANHLRVIACKYLINKSYCNDVVSDAFVKVLQYIDSFDKNQDGYNWLCKIVEKTAYTYNECEKTDREKSISIELIEGVGVKNDVDEAKIDLIKAMENLEPQYREALYDYFYNDMTYEELAAKYNIVKSAAYKRVQTAFKNIKKFLQNGEQNK